MTLITEKVRALPYTRPYVWMIAAWVLSMISLPIARWTWGDSVIPIMSLIGVIFQFAAVIVILQARWGTRRTLITALIVAVLTWSVEALGSKTGFPFGVYSYTDLLQPQLLDVPLLIPLAWMMMLGPSWAVAYVIVGRDLSTFGRRAAFVALSAAAITAWDLYLDPQMVGWGFWIWAEPSGYFGIPWVNYLGWLGTGALVTLAARPDHLPVTPLIVIYGIVWILQAIGLAVFWNQPGPAFFGFAAMGGLLALAYARRNRS